jgi:FkbM family methyltransferase
MYHYHVDWEEFNLISKYVKPGDAVFDIGANMGLYTVWMSQFIGEGKIHAFEPDPANYERLEQSIFLNNLQTQVIANKKAVSEVDGELAFSKGLDIENHIVASTDQNVQFIQSQQIDSYVSQKNIPSIAYMKIDVEGFEYSVLKSAHSILLNKNIDIIQLEINKSISNSGKSTTDLLDLINRYQYSLCRYDVKANRLIKAAYSPDRENYFAVNDLDKINLKLGAHV